MGPVGDRRAIQAAIFTRRSFIARVAAVGGLTTLAQLPAEIARVAPAHAQDANLTIDTFNGLAAFVWPGDDTYSVSQGESASRPGAVAANAGPLLVEALDFFVPQPDEPTQNNDTVVLSDGIASIINTVALTVNPLGVPGALFPSAFARLSFADKAEAWRVLEEDTQELDSSTAPAPFTNSSGALQLIFGLLPGFAQFFAFSEADVFEPDTKTLATVPVGWAHSGYQGGDRTTPVQGWDEFIGYYNGRKAADP